MAKFTYQARTKSGKTETGQLIATDEAEVRVLLKSMGKEPLRIAALATAAQKKNVNANKKVNTKDLQIFTRQLATLINAGIPISEAFLMLGQGRRNANLKEAAKSVRSSIESGKRLGDAMAEYPGIFDRLYVNMVKAGEEAGILDGILNRLAIYLEKSQKIKNQVKGAMMYPAIIIVLATVVILGILLFIIPKFQQIYAEGGAALPALTQMVVNISTLLMTKWHLVLGGGIAIFFIVKTWLESPEGNTEFQRIMIRAPIFGDVIQKSSMARMSRTLGTLLQSGVGVIDALEIAARTSGNIVVEETLLKSKDSVVAGKPLAVPLQREKMIPEMVTQMIAIGEKSGTLDVMLGKIADFYEDEVENAVKGMTSMIEPLLMVVLGIIIAVLVLAMYLPIFNMANMGGH